MAIWAGRATADAGRSVTAREVVCISSSSKVEVGWSRHTARRHHDSVCSGGLNDADDISGSKSCKSRPDSYVLRTIHADGTERVEAFNNAGELAARQQALQDVLSTDGWTGPHGWVA